MRKIKNEFKRTPLFFCGILVAICALIYSKLIYHPPEIPFNENEKVTLRGVIVEKDLTEDGELKSIFIKGDYNFRVFIYKEDVCSAALPLKAEVIVTGHFKNFADANNPGEYSFKKYYSAKNYWFYVNLEEISLVKKPFLPIDEWFLSLRFYFTDSVRHHCPLEGNTINTLLFGDKSGLDDDRRNLYRSTGLAHFLVISGLHISVAGGGIYTAIRRTGIKRKYAALTGITVILFYASVVGFTVSVMRSVIMFVVRLVADMINRSYDMLSALSLAAIITLIKNPLWICDSAFQYSYVAVLAIGLYMGYEMTAEEELSKNLIARKHGKSKIKEMIRLRFPIPLLIYLSLLPLSLYYQSYSNILSVVLNILLGLLTTPIILFGAMAFFFGLLNMPFFPKLFDFFVAILLKIIDLASSICLHADGFKIIHKPSLPVILIYYMVVLFFLFRMLHKASFAQCLFILLSAVIFLGSTSSPFPSVTFLDVGQGDCIVIKTDRHRAIINDCGSSSNSESGQYKLLPYLLAEGITEIMDIYVSHGDSDHINGLFYLMENASNYGIRINRLILPYLENDMYEGGLAGLYNLANSLDIPVRFISNGDIITYQQCYVGCLWPDRKKLINENNADSLVLWFRYGSFDMLLTGDCTVETEKMLDLSSALVYSDDGKIEVLKCAHHGSASSSSEDFIDAISPMLTAISVGRDNPYGHPRDSVLKILEKTGTKILRTDECGAITIYILPNKMKYKTFR